jgi:hypothetical protein
MRSVSRRELLLLGFGAVADGVWCGMLAAVLSGDPGPRHLILATGVVYAAALIALHSGRGRRPGRRARALAVGLALAVAAGLLVAGRVWDAEMPVPSVVLDVAYASLLVVVGAGLGGSAMTPDVASRRGVRAFALTCAVVVVATLADAAPSWSLYPLAVSLVAGALFVAAVRYETLAALTPATERPPAWPWLLAVLGASLLVVAAGVLASEVLHVDLLARALTAAGAVLQYLLALVAYAVAWTGGALVRALGWVLGLFNLHEIKLEPPERPSLPETTMSPEPVRGEGGHLPRVLTVGVLAALAVGACLSLVALALRRFRRPLPDDVEEERESVSSLRAAAAAGAGRLAGRLRRLVARPRPRTPAELVRRRYTELERRLGKAGHERAPGTTVRGFLVAVAAETGAAPGLAAQLARVYELARYSTETVDAAAAGAFETRALEFGALVTPA